MATVHLLIRHWHPVADSSAVLPLEFSRVRVTSTQVHLLNRSAVAGDAVWTVATLEDRCHQSSCLVDNHDTVGVIQCSSGWWIRRDSWSGEKHATLVNVLSTLLDTERLYIIRGALFQRQSRPHPPLSQLKASFLSRVLAPTPSRSKSLNHPKIVLLRSILLYSMNIQRPIE